MNIGTGSKLLTRTELSAAYTAQNSLLLVACPQVCCNLVTLSCCIPAVTLPLTWSFGRLIIDFMDNRQRCQILHVWFVLTRLKEEAMDSWNQIYP